VVKKIDPATGVKNSQWVNFRMPKQESNVIAHKKPTKKLPTIVELGKRD